MKRGRFTKENPRIFAAYDHEAMLNSLDAGKKRRVFERYFDGGVHAYNERALHEHQREQLLIAGNHQSHFDYILASRVLLENLPDGKFPHIVAGASLDKPFIPTIIGFDYRNGNTCWFNRRRERDGAYLKKWGRAVRERLANGESFMYYPQGTRVFKSGGEMQTFKGPFFLSQVLSAYVNPLVLTFTVDYDHPIEEPYHKIIEWGRKKRKGQRALSSPPTEGWDKRVIEWGKEMQKGFVDAVSNAVYYTADAMAFLRRSRSRERGGAYLKVGEPVRLSEIVGGTDKRKAFAAVANFISQEVRRDYQFIQEQKEKLKNTNKGREGFKDV